MKKVLTSLLVTIGITIVLFLATCLLVGFPIILIFLLVAMFFVAIWIGVHDEMTKENRFY